MVCRRFTSAGVTSELRHRPAIRGRDVEHALTRALGGEAVVAGRDLEAGSEALDVPLERSRRRLVEVVDVEHQAAVGRGEPPEVGQVGVTAELHLEIGGGRHREIGRHDERRAPVEGERRHQHALVAQRHELGDASLLL